MFLNTEQILTRLDEDTIINQNPSSLRQLSDSIEHVFSNASDDMKEDIRGRACKIWNASVRYEMNKGEEGKSVSCELKKLSLSLFRVCSRNTTDDNIHNFLIASKTAKCLDIFIKKFNFFITFT